MIRRGDVVTIADRTGGDYAGKPRPAVVVRSDHFAKLDSVLICPITSVALPENLLRLALQPSATLPLERPSWIAIEKLSAIRRARIGERIGWLSAADLLILTRHLVLLIGAA
jgi:mRNA interferase MazF